MAPTALIPSEIPQTISGLNQSGVQHVLKDTAPSVLRSDYSNSLQELNAANLSYTYAEDHRQVPEVNSPEEWSQST